MQKQKDLGQQYPCYRRIYLNNLKVGKNNGYDLQRKTNPDYDQEAQCRGQWMMPGRWI